MTALGVVVIVTVALLAWGGSWIIILALLGGRPPGWSIVPLALAGLVAAGLFLRWFEKFGA
jgi:hypothetical protein